MNFVRLNVMKQKRTKPKKEAPKKADERPRESEKESSPYGGIPMRDLKKNLGCG
jgi:hypothetical protein